MALDKSFEVFVVHVLFFSLKLKNLIYLDWKNLDSFVTYQKNNYIK